MPGEFKRLFVGNLPPGATESDLENEFNAYGEVLKVELKRKENLVDPENPLLFAFININIINKSLDLCLDEFSRQKFRGRLLTVSVARESFLDRLKREREEATGKEEKAPIQLVTNRPTPQKSAKLLPQIAKEDSGDSSSSESSEHEEVETAPNETPSTAAKNKRNQDEGENEDEDALFTKKRASASLYNGKIKIQSVNSEPIHVITKHQKNERQLDEQAKKADQKRKESLNKMKNQYNQQKLAIQNALTDVDKSKRKRIVFDDEEVANGDPSLENQSKKNKLFGDDEETEDVSSYEKDFKIKEQFLGKGGDKLLGLQSKYNLDRRFQLDERFVENEQDDETNESVKGDSKEIDEERSWQLGIIEQVVGRKFETLPALDKKKLKKTMLRFDPGKEEHQKFLQKVTNVVQTFKNDKRKKDEGTEVEVSKEQFYSVNDDLTKSLKSRGDGFSLISMFGNADEDTEKQAGDHENVYEEKVLKTGKTEKGFLNNAFKYDSSDSEEEAELDSNAAPKAKDNIKENQKAVGGGPITKKGIRIETFFLCEGDERLKEGRTFFKTVKTKDGEVQDYDKVKDRLRQIINKKIAKSRRGDKKFQNKNKFKRK